MRDLNTLRDLTLAWSSDRGILKNGKTTTQALKLVSEVGELCDNVGKGRSTKDDIGDCLVVLTNLAFLENLTLEECWEFAYEEIKDRRGYLNEHGNFIKEGDVPKAITIKEIKVISSLFSDMFEVHCLLSDNTEKSFTFCGTLPMAMPYILDGYSKRDKTLEDFKTTMGRFGQVVDLEVVRAEAGVR